MPIFDWCVVGCKYKNNHFIDMCWKDIGLHVQNLLPILDVVVKTIARIHTFICKLIEYSLWHWKWFLYELQKLQGKWLWTQFGFVCPNCSSQFLQQEGSKRKMNNFRPLTIGDFAKILLLPWGVKLVIAHPNILGKKKKERKQENNGTVRLCPYYERLQM